VADFAPSRPGKRKAPTEAAQVVALVIKRNFPIVKVSVYDSVDNSTTLVEAPAALS
jgi:hypothetical protein